MTQRLVFAGDSITDAGRDRTDDDSFGDGYVSLIADELPAQGADVVVVNRGVSGDRAVDLERRWEADVRAQRPDVLTVYVGVNDMWRRFDSDDPTSAQEFEATYRRLLAGTDADRILLIEPYFLPVRAEQAEWPADLDEKRAVIARLAQETGAVLVPLQETFSRAAAEHGVAAIAPDGVHPTPAGSRLIADAWLAAYADREAGAR
ncbi:SGNH/GDSL hydrolase family protein [Leifsonia sp. ZF2019]|uniref:SGNH/GDSL hydrolase family protein n=1 Tax=Leifsonia sp. ZF2019 TaxID=2781978 RepID=UPI001CBBF53C|nr:SGNH/GDSL hydrolase family protein [Leifsonia sp. ZF2019]UAJ78927.1 SGNH/GDSL hydrolase family protein [Leifsonia sp. ZF2019]